MSRTRHDKTLVDYMAIAISPALIMVLVGSLAFFLLTVFYQGAFAGRLTWIMSCFVFAAVLIARISMEEGAQTASVYGLALAAAVALAIGKFIQQPYLAWTVLAVIWYCAHQLTWNCTLIDESEDASGEGLLEIVGLDPEVQTESGGRKAEGGKRKEAANQDDARPFHQRVVTWFTRQRSRHSAPGLWVVYFSLGALPIFGLGQLLIPKANFETRQYAFRLVFWYVASALGLLLTTSFLGLRRYLRQKRLPMPADMAGVWLAAGGAMIVAILVASLLVPRPNAEYAISALTGSVTSPELRASRHAPLQDSPAQDDPEKPSSSRGEATDDSQSQDAKTSDAQGNQTNPDAEATRQGDGKAAGGKQQSQQGRGEAKSSESPSNDDTSKSLSRDPQASAEQNAEDGKRTAEENSSPGEESKTAADDSGDKSDESSAPRDGDQPPADARASGTSSTSPSRSLLPRELPSPSAVAGGFFLLIKWLLYAVVAAVVLYLLVRHRDAAAAWLRGMWQALLDIWSGLFGGRRKAIVVQESPAEKPRPFAAFQDPFLTGQAHQAPVEEVVRYTFEALEAWATEQGLPRGPEETPLEFSRRLAEEDAPVAGSAQELAGLYARVAYARQRLSPDCLPVLQVCWQQMRTTRAVTT